MSKLRNYDCPVYINKKETDTITKILSQAGKTFRTLDSGVLTMIAEDEE